MGSSSKNVIANVPQDKVMQVLNDLTLEFGTSILESVRVTLQPNGLKEVEYPTPLSDQNSSGSYASSFTR